jgi:hypothetical protein
MILPPGCSKIVECPDIAGVDPEHYLDDENPVNGHAIKGEVLPRKQVSRQEMSSECPASLQR